MSTISARYPTPFTPACDGHPMAPIAGPQADPCLSEARRRGGAFRMGTAENHSLCKLALGISRLS